MDDVTFQHLTRGIEELLGLDLSAYKQQQMRRRVTTFLVRNGLPDGSEGVPDAETILRQLQCDGPLLQALRDMLTINVTEFFRDVAQWERLETDILPELLTHRRGLKIWSAGCSHGQEALTLAMVLDHLGALRGSRIVGTDFDRRSVSRARAGGPYSVAEMEGVPEADRRKHFQSTPAGFVAQPALRRSIRFSELNLIEEPFDSGYDLIVCRNVMIYFESEVKADLVRKFQEALRPGGILFIGATEALLGRERADLKHVGGNFYRRPVAAPEHTA